MKDLAIILGIRPDVIRASKILKLLKNQSDIEKIPNIKFNLRPSEICPEIYYKITEIFERKMNL